MKEKSIKLSKIIAIIVLIVLIAILAKFITNRKEATYVSSENATENVAESNTQENVWQINTTSNTTNTEKSDNTENSAATNEQSNNVTTNTSTNQVVENTTSTENNVVTNTTTSKDTNTTKSSSTTSSTKSSSDFGGVIWLTFDDGPSANITPKVLDILKKENIKATFFVINYSESNEHLVKRAVEEGHTIGIHGYSHEYSKIYQSKETFMSNVYTLQDRIEKSTGVKTMYTRFPGGSSNTVSKKYCKGIMTELTKEMLAKGFKYYDWNISSGDAGGAKTGKDMYNNVVKNLSKKRGNMVLMHDFGSNKKVLDALPDIIEYGKKNGYTFAAIDDNTPMYAQKVNN